MSEQPTLYVDQVAPEPVNDSTVPNTAENVLRWTAVLGLRAYSDLESMPGKDDPDFTEKALRWFLRFHEFTGAFNLHLVLTRLRQLDPAAADETADLIVRAYEAGDSYGEWLYQWVEEHGIDAQRVIGEDKAKREEQP